MYFCSVIPDANRSRGSDSISGILSIQINKKFVPSLGRMINKKSAQSDMCLDTVHSLKMLV